VRGDETALRVDWRARRLPLHRLLGERRPPLALLLAGIAIGIAASLPAAYLVVVIADGAAVAWDAVWSSRTAALVGRTAALAAAVTTAAVSIGVTLAWLTVRSDLPGRRAWATLATLPLVIPSYIGAYLLVSALGPRGELQGALEVVGIERLPSIYGFVGACLALTLFTYPLVMIPVRGALRRLDPQLEEAATTLGRRPLAVLRSVVIPQLAPAIGAGALLVALYTLSDFGAVSIMRFNSLTRDIYISATSSFDRTGAAALGAVLLFLTLGVLVVYLRIRNRTAYHRTGPGTARPAATVPLGSWKLPAIAFCSLIVALALLLPFGMLVYWSTKELGSGLELGSVAANAGNSLLAGSFAAGAAALAAIVVAILAVRFRSPTSTAIERLSYAGYALPGIVVALALVFVGTRVAPALYQTFAMLVFALAVHYLPLAVGPVAASLLQVSPRVEEAARGLGRGPLQVFGTITTPLAASGVLAGTALVFLHAVKELPATLLLAPIGFETLATDIWRQTSVGFFEAGAIPALVLLLVAAPPLYLLSERGTVAS
jgi:iron(III) transport system permease protein